MKMRKLQMQDAHWMLEWMHDDTVVHYLRGNFAEKTIDDCIRFILKSRDETENIHLAVVDDSDEYMGTVSLKHIRQNTAEFAIALRASAMGRGYASFGMKAIMEYGYRSRGIDSFYWCVDPDNQRALSFYGKHSCRRGKAPDLSPGYTDEDKGRYIWYSVCMAK